MKVREWTYLVGGRHLGSFVLLLLPSDLFPDSIKLLFVLLDSLSDEVTLNSRCIHDVHRFDLHLFQVGLSLLVFVWVFYG